MASSSLTKMTVPLASDQSPANQTLLMPKYKWAFRVVFENFGVSTPRTELTKQVMSFKRPEVSFDDIMINTYNSRIKLAGKPSWSDCSVTLRDDVTGSVAKLVGEQLQKQFDFQEQSIAASGIDYKFTTRIETLDGGNGVHGYTVLETWELYGCFLSGSNWDQFDYSSGSEIMTIPLTIKFDNALQVPGDVGVGANVGRTLGNSITG